MRTPVQVTLRAMREKMSMTQQQFSEVLGVTLVTICRWENQRPPIGLSLLKLAAFARASGIAEATEVFEKALEETPVKNAYEWRAQYKRLEDIYKRLDDIDQRLSRMEATLARLEKHIASPEIRWRERKS